MIPGIVASQQLAAAASPVSVFGSVVFLSSFDLSTDPTHAIDDSLSAHPILFAGAALVDGGQAKFGDSSLLLDGVGSYAYAPSDADFLHAADPFTLEFFLRLPSIAGVNCSPIGVWGAAGARSHAIRVVNSGGMRIRYVYSEDGTTTSTALNTAASIIAGTWHHIAVARSADGFVRSFLDGALVDTSISAVPALFAADAPLSIGAHSDGSLGVPGTIDEVRVTRACLYDAAFTAPTSAFPRS